MIPRAALWITGVAALALYGWVGVFSFGTLGPVLGCDWGPETRFWGYDAATFAACFDPVPATVVDAYRDVLTGADRALAVSLAAFLVLWSLHVRTALGALAGVVYGAADWTEGVYLIQALDGDLGAVGMASVLTTAKMAGLLIALIACFRARRHGRRMT